MKLTTITKTSGVAWVHAAADPELLDAHRAELARLTSPETINNIKQRWPDSLNPWAVVAERQHTAAVARLNAIIAAQEAAITIKQLEEAVKEAQASNAAL